MDMYKGQREDPPSDAQLRRELQALVAARQELGEGCGVELKEAGHEQQRGGTR